MSASTVAKYTPLEVGAPHEDAELADLPHGAPRHWQGILKPGAGQCECQGYETWTPEEKQKWKAGLLTSKWAVGQVSIRLPIDGPLTFVALVYGYLPFVIPIWWAVWALETYIRDGEARFFPLYGLSIAAGFAIVNEVVTKKICKLVLSAEITNRPPEAVCRHPGMPSGHVMNAYTIMNWCLLEVIFDKLVHPEWLLVILLILGPVPWARVYNRDHTTCQVLTSAIVSIFMGCAAFYIRYTHFPTESGLWDWYHVDSMEMNGQPALRLNETLTNLFLTTALPTTASSSEPGHGSHKGSH